MQVRASTRWVLPGRFPRSPGGRPIPDPRHRDSIDAWRWHSGLENLNPPTALDAGSLDWGLDTPGGPPADGIAVLIAINVLHITPWRVSEGLFAGAGRHLTAAGHLCIYGPFSRTGDHSAQSNRQFDASLRMQNPDWGVRDVDDLSTLARANGLSLIEDVAMPRDNSVLVFRREWLTGIVSVATRPGITSPNQTFTKVQTTAGPDSARCLLSKGNDLLYVSSSRRPSGARGPDDTAFEVVRQPPARHDPARNRASGSRNG